MCLNQLRLKWSHRHRNKVTSRVASRANRAENISPTVWLGLCVGCVRSSVCSLSPITHVEFFAQTSVLLFSPPLPFVCALEMLFEKNMIRKQIVPLERENYSHHSRTLDLTATCTHTFTLFFSLIFHYSISHFICPPMSSHCTFSFYILIYTHSTFAFSVYLQSTN